MKVTVDRKPHRPEEDFAVAVIASDEDRQVTITVWSEKNAGKHRMRQEGLGYLKVWEAHTLKPLLNR